MRTPRQLVGLLLAGLLVLAALSLADAFGWIEVWG